MTLVIEKKQSGKFFGGVSFELNATVRLTSDESALVQKYSVQSEVLMKKDISILLKTISIDITIGSLIDGQNFKCANIAEILEYENNVKVACESFKNYLVVMKNFGGEETIEF